MAAWRAWLEQGALEGADGAGGAARAGGLGRIYPARRRTAFPPSTQAGPQRAAHGQICGWQARFGPLEQLDLGGRLEAADGVKGRGRASARPRGSVHRFW